ncbi:MAG: hypothetical protein ABL999_09210 [Pyrinomonadaceae bacterium]
MNIETFDKLRKFDTTSWAIWNEKEDSSVSFFRSQLECLHGRSVFVGLNRSESWQENLENTCLSNFHTPGHTADRRLKRIIQDANLQNLIGSFMTDISEEVKTDSGLVNVEEHGYTADLVAKITSIDKIDRRSIVCFGDKAFKILRTGLGISSRLVSKDSTNLLKSFSTHVNKEIWHVFRVWHPSNYGKFIHKSEQELPIQLAYINGAITALN